MTIDEVALKAAIGHWDALTGEDCLGVIEAYEQAKNFMGGESFRKDGSRILKKQDKVASTPPANTALVQKLVEALRLSIAALDDLSACKYMDCGVQMCNHALPISIKALTEANAWLLQQEGKSSEGVGYYMEALRQIANGCEDPMDVAHRAIHHGTPIAQQGKRAEGGL